MTLPATMALILAIGLAESLAQAPGQKITFHVTAVRSEDARDVCASNSDCSARRFTVEGYSDTTEYVLDCVEIVTAKPSHLLVGCDHLHAHNDYAARLMSDAIAFGDTKPHEAGGPGQSAYNIVSEKEAGRKQ